MIDLVCLSIAIGLVVSLYFSEALGKAAGGLVVPGYLALHLTRPLDIGLTVAAAALTYFVVHWGASFFIVYGKRRTAAMILVGFLFGMLFRAALLFLVPYAPGEEHAGMAVIGFIIPGLIAIWFDRQGLLDTCTTMITASAVVRLVLVLLMSSQLQLFELEHSPLPSDQPVFVQPAETPGLAAMEPS